MPRTEGEKISRQKYESKAYDQILLKVKKGKRDEYKQAAERFGLGQMEMIRLAVEKFIVENTGEEFKPTTQDKQPRLSADEKELLDAFNQLPTDAQKGLIRTCKAFNCLIEDALQGRSRYFEMFKEELAKNHRLAEENEKLKKNKPAN